MEIRDPTIDRIRQARREISEEFGHDPKRLVAHYIEYQEQFSAQLLNESSSSTLNQLNSPARGLPGTSRKDG